MSSKTVASTGRSSLAHPAERQQNVANGTKGTKESPSPASSQASVATKSKPTPKLPSVKFLPPPPPPLPPPKPSEIQVKAALIKSSSESSLKQAKLTPKPQKRATQELKSKNSSRRTSIDSTTHHETATNTHNESPIMNPKLTDRRRSSEERKRLAKEAAKKLFSHSIRGTSEHSNPSKFKRNSVGTLSFRMGGGVSSARGSKGRSKELCRDFLTLAFHRAVGQGRLKIVKAMQRSGRVPLVDRMGNTPLHVAARSGQLKCLRWLQQHLSIPLLARNARGETCTHLAALHGHLQCLQAILAAPQTLAAKLEAVAERDNNGMTCLHVATLEAREGVVSWLSRVFGRDMCLVRSEGGLLAIHLAAACGYLACTEILVQVCCQSALMRDIGGATPVFYAAQGGHLETVKYLVEWAKGSLRQTTWGGLSPLLGAAESGHLPVVRYILDREGEDVLRTSADDGATALHLAAANGQASMVRHLLECSGGGQMLWDGDEKGWTPAHYAARAGHVQCLQLLVEAGLSLYLPDQEGETAMSLAMRSSSPPCVLYARALYQTTVDQCTSSKTNKKKLGSHLREISGVVSIQAVGNKEDPASSPPSSSSSSFSSSSSLSSSRPDGIFQWPKIFGRDKSAHKKMGQKASSARGHHPAPPGLSGHDLEDPDFLQTAWPSWHESLLSRGPPRASDRGIFRGEFILLRSSPPTGVRGRSEGEGGQRAAGRNAHLYVQRNRPGPVSLPLKRNDRLPPRLHPYSAEDEEILKDSLDRCLQKASTDVLKKYGVQCHGHNFREPSLGGIREEEEEEEDDDEDEEEDEEEEEGDLMINNRLTSYTYSPTIYTCPCWGQTDKFRHPCSDMQASLSTLGRRTPLKKDREILKSSRITLPPVREDQPERSPSPTEDYSSDESGISEQDGDHSDHEDKAMFFLSSADDNQQSKRPSSASSDSALRDWDNHSSLSSEGAGSHHDREGFHEEMEGEESCDQNDSAHRRSSKPIVTEVIVHSDDCSSLFSFQRSEGEYDPQYQRMSDVSSAGLSSELASSAHSFSEEHDDVCKLLGSKSSIKTGSSTSFSDAESRSDERLLIKDDSSDVHSNLSDKGDDLGNLSSASASSFSTVSQVTSTATPPPPPPPPLPVPPPPPSLQSSPTPAPPASKTHHRPADSAKSTSDISDSGSLGEVLRQSINNGTFVKQATQRRRDSISPSRQKVCHAVFGSSSLKRSSAHSKSGPTDGASGRRFSAPFSSTETADATDHQEEKKEAAAAEVHVKQKCSGKIKALQSILIKQSLPFAKPQVMETSFSRRSSLEALNDKNMGVTAECESQTRSQSSASSATSKPVSTTNPDSEKASTSKNSKNESC